MFRTGHFSNNSVSWIQNKNVWIQWTNHASTEPRCGFSIKVLFDRHFSLTISFQKRGRCQNTWLHSVSIWSEKRIFHRLFSLLQTSILLLDDDGMMSCILGIHSIEKVDWKWDIPQVLLIHNEELIEASWVYIFLAHSWGAFPINLIMEEVGHACWLFSRHNC